MSPRPLAVRLGILAAAAFVYFVLYPDDLAALLAPAEKVPPWLYVLLGIAMVTRTLATIWGRNRQGSVPLG